MSEKIQNITIYKQPYKSDRLDAYVNCVLSEDFSKNLARSKELACEIRKFICDEISSVKMADAPEQITKVAEGSSSVCYRSDSNEQCKYIYKLFAPQGIRTDTEYGFVWLSDDATDEECVSFLRRFARFIKQIETIQSVVEQSNHEERNLLVKLQLSLTSLGFVWRADVLYGETLQQIFNDNPILSTPQDVYDRMQLVLNLSHEIQFLHRDQIFHGDIKPDNFLKASFKQGHYNVCNIDYDTCLAIDQRKEGHPQHLLASTASFYSSTILKNLAKSKTATFDDWAALDVKALAKVLMCALGFNIEALSKEEKNSLSTDELGDWNELFTKSNAFQNLFMALGAKDKLSSLYIVNKLTRILGNCSYNAKPSKKITTVDRFIAELKSIADMIGVLFNVCPNNQVTDDIVKCRGLDELQRQQKQQKYFLNDVVNREFQIDDEVEKVIAKCFDVTNTDPNVKPIDKRLLPTISCEEMLYGPIETIPPYSDIRFRSEPRIEVRWYGQIFTYSFNGDTPLNQLVTTHPEKNFFLSANGGAGKTTTLFAFWLDYLASTHNKTCIYVDLKRLDPAEEANAIRNFMLKNSEYAIDLTAKPRHDDFILLLDGANETSSELRSNGVSDCYLVEEIKQLIENGYRIVLSNRTEVVSVLGAQHDDTKTKQSRRRYWSNVKREFETDCMLYCKLVELTDEQVSYVAPSIDKNSTAYKLLKNNMMLSIFGTLAQYKDVLKDGTVVTGGWLLQQYFEICFQARYIKTLLKRKESEFELYEKIIAEQREEKISDAIDKYKMVFDFLVEHACCNVIDGEQIAGNRVFEITEHLGVLTNNDGKYVWTNEIYQEYFKACLLVKILAELEKGKPFVLPVHITENLAGYSMSFMHFDNHYIAYNDSFSQLHLRYFNAFIIKLISEIGNYDQQKLDAISEKVNDNSIASKLVINLSQLLGLNIPVGFVELTDHCSMGITNKIVLPSHVKTIGNRAFIADDKLEEVIFNCDELQIKDYAFASCSSLKTLQFNCSSVRIENYPFALCSSLEKVDIGCKVKFVSKSGAFANCIKLKQVSLSDVEVVDDSLFHNCQSLEKVELNGVKSDIDTLNFYECPALKQVMINGTNWIKLKTDNIECERRVGPFNTEKETFYVLKTVWGLPTNCNN